MANRGKNAIVLESPTDAAFSEPPTRAANSPLLLRKGPGRSPGSTCRGHTVRHGLGRVSRDHASVARRGHLRAAARDRSGVRRRGRPRKRDSGGGCLSTGRLVAGGPHVPAALVLRLRRALPTLPSTIGTRGPGRACRALRRARRPGLRPRAAQQGVAPAGRVAPPRRRRRCLRRSKSDARVAT